MAAPVRQVNVNFTVLKSRDDRDFKTIKIDNNPNILAIDREERIIVVQSMDPFPMLILYQANFVFVWKNGYFTIAKNRHGDKLGACAILSELLNMQLEVVEDNRICPSKEDRVILKLKGFI